VHNATALIVILVALVAAGIAWMVYIGKGAR
jgi:hypothetical protein